jgi:hypothetical protein
MVPQRVHRFFEILARWSSKHHRLADYLAVTEGLISDPPPAALAAFLLRA